MKFLKQSNYKHTKTASKGQTYINILIDRHTKEKVIMGSKGRPEDQNGNTCHVQSLKYLLHLQRH